MLAYIGSILDRDRINAFCRHTHAERRGASRGPLAGLTCGVKDVFDLAGSRTGFGCPRWFETHLPAERTAACVQDLLDAGADVVGKTHTHELALGLSGENEHYGTPVNVRAPGRVPGGSSSGSAAAVAAGLVDFALGSDTGGSVRGPASFCGVYGIRPTHGRISLEGICPLAPSFDTVGWFSRDPELLARVGRVLLKGRRDDSLPRRALIARDAFEIADPNVASALAPGVERISSALGGTSTVTISEEGLAGWFQVFHMLRGLEVWAQLGPWVLDARPALGPVVSDLLRWAYGLDPAEASPMRERRAEIRRRVEDMLRDDAVLVLPTMPSIAPPLGLSASELADFRARAMSLLCIAGLAGLPQISVPCGTVAGCPVGLSLVGSRGSDERLLRLASLVGSLDGSDAAERREGKRSIGTVEGSQP